MELGYAIFILLLYVVLVIAGIWLYEYMETRRAIRQPVRLVVLTEQEKRKKLNELIAAFGFAYDGRQDIFYSRTDSWQRKFGYGKIYDEAAAPLNMIIDCEPIYFDYDGKHWLIEFWKGQYGICTGAEVGIYYLPAASKMEELLLSNPIYRCVEDEDILRIKTVLWKKGRQMYFRRGYHWWLTGFRVGEFSWPKELEMDIEITMKDYEMRNAFLEGLYAAGYGKEEVSASGTRVWIHFSKPHSKQPLTRAKIFSAVKQWENRRNCRLFQQATGGYVHTYDKLMALQTRMPGIYRKLERLSSGRFRNREKTDGQI